MGSHSILQSVAIYNNRHTYNGRQKSITWQTIYSKIQSALSGSNCCLRLRANKPIHWTRIEPFQIKRCLYILN